MDESWRISIGSMAPRRWSTDQDRRSRRAAAAAEPALEPDDFRDVFGGPPRTVLLRQFSCELSCGDRRPANFYDEIFRRAELGGFPGLSGRNLPGLRIPAVAVAVPARGGLVKTEEGFYDDIFGSDGGGVRRSRSRSKSKSKSNSSSVLSSEDLSPLRPSIAEEDGMLNSIASKLRPITIPSRHHYSSPPSTLSGGEQSCCSPTTLTIPSSTRFIGYSVGSSSTTTTDFFLRHHRQLPHIAFSSCFSPPETSFHRSLKKKPGADISEAASPSSATSSVRELEKVVVEVGEEEAERPPFLIQINGGGHRMGETEGAAAVDEAIAWAKEKFWSQVGSNVLEEVSRGDQTCKENEAAFEEHKKSVGKGETRQLEGTLDV